MSQSLLSCRIQFTKKFRLRVLECDCSKNCTQRGGNWFRRLRLLQTSRIIISVTKKRIAQCPIWTLPFLPRQRSEKTKPQKSKIKVFLSPVFQISKRALVWDELNSRKMCNNSLEPTDKWETITTQLHKSKTGAFGAGKKKKKEKKSLLEFFYSSSKPGPITAKSCARSETAGQGRSRADL